MSNRNIYKKRRSVDTSNLNKTEEILDESINTENKIETNETVESVATEKVATPTTENVKYSGIDPNAPLKDRLKKGEKLGLKIIAGVVGVIILVAAIVSISIRCAHKHTYSDEWTIDETYHFHKATCKHKQLSIDKEVHDYEYGVCTTCGYSIVENTTVTIPSDATSIKANAYASMKDLDKVVIPSSVKEIGENAFPNSTDVLVEGDVREFAYKGNNNIYYYSETEPKDNDPRQYWHYVNGEATLWHEHTYNTVVWASDSQYHYHAADCGHDKRIDETAHSFEYGICTVCNYNIVNAKEVIIPEGVTSLSENAFKGCNNIESVVLPSTLTSVGANAFKDCANLKSFDASKSQITEIGDYAFYNCKNLNEVKLPSSLKSIGISSFENCSSLTSIDINSCETIKDDAFNSCTKLESVNLPSNLKNLGESVFTNNTSLKSIIIPEGVTELSDVFTNCSSLSSVEFSGNNLKKLEETFNGCTSLKNITLPESLEEISKSTFANTGLESITIPSKVTLIERNTFADCTNLKEAVINGNVTTIENGAFRNTSLERIVLPESVSEIASDAFDSNVLLYSKKTEITNLGSSNTTYFYSETNPLVYDETNELTEVTNNDLYWSYINETPSIWHHHTYSTEFTYDIDQHWHAASCIHTDATATYEPFHDKNMQQQINPTSTKYYHVEYMDCGECDCGFDVDDLDSTVYHIADGVKSIHINAFEDTNITEVYIPASVESIGESAFQECESLKYIYFDSNSTITLIPYTFAVRCTKLETVVLPKTITIIDEFAFKECRKLTNINLSSTALTTISYDAFYYSGLSENLLLPASVETIDQFAFYGTNISNIYLGESLKTIGEYAFAYCDNLNEILLPKTVESIGTNAFTKTNSDNTKSMKIYYLGTDLNSDGKLDSNRLQFSETNYFYYYSKDYPNRVYNQYWHYSSDLKSKEIWHVCSDFYNGVCKVCNLSLVDEFGKVVLPDGITTISSGAFKNFKHLKEIVIPASVKTISSEAFNGCIYLTKVTFSDDSELTRIDKDAFTNCTSLNEIIIPKTIENLNSEAFDSTITKYINQCTIKSGFEELQPLGHNFSEHKEYKDATCTENGNYEYYYCDRCGIYYKDAQGSEAYEDDAQIIANGHKYGDFIEAATACTVDGCVAHYHCSVCGKDFDENYQEIEGGATIAATGSHSEANYNTSSYSHNIFYHWYTLTCSHAHDETLPSDVEMTQHDFENGKCTTCGYEYNSNELVIPSSWTTIPDYAFYGNNTIKKIVISKNVISVGKYAFGKISTLTEIVFEDSINLSELSEGMFDSCNSLTKVTIPASVEVINNRAFADCQNLTTVNYQSGSKIKSIGTIDKTNTNVKNSLRGTSYDGAFAQTSIKNIYIPSTVETIGDYAFGMTPFVESIEFESNSRLTEIGKYGFYAVSYYKPISSSLILPESLTTLGDYAFAYSGIQSISIPSKIEVISEGAFNCSQLTSIVIPNTVKSILDGAFASISSLTSVTFESNSILENIGTYEPDDENWMYYSYYKEFGAFYGAPITTITIPSSVKLIGNYALGGCAKLKDILFEDNSNLTTVGIGAFYSLYNGSDSATNITSYTTIALPDTVSTIAEEAFELAAIRSFTIPTSVDKISSYVFYKSSLVSISIPSKITLIDQYAFNNCPFLSTITFAADSQLDTIGAQAFSSSSLLNIVIPQSVTTLKNYAFANFTGKSFKFESGSNIESIPDYAFYRFGENQSNIILDTLTLPENITSIGKQAFVRAYISYLVIPTSVETIDSSAFNDDKDDNTTIYNKISYIISNKIDSLAGLNDNVSIFINCDFDSMKEAFSNASNYDSMFAYSETEYYKSWHYVKEVPTIWGHTTHNYDHYTISDNGHTKSCACGDTGTYTLEAHNFEYGKCKVCEYDITDKTEYTIPTNITKLNANAFANCTNLEKLTIPTNVTNMANSAFSGCTALKTIIYNGSNADYAANVTGYPFDVLTEYYFILTDYAVYENQDLNITAITFELNNGTYTLSSINTNGIVNSIVIPSTINGVKVTTLKTESIDNVTYSLTLPNTITTIESQVFTQDNIAISDVYYQGTRAQWNAIAKQEYSQSDETAIFSWANNVSFKLHCTDDTEEYSKLLDYDNDGANYVSKGLCTDKDITLPKTNLFSGNEVTITKIKDFSNLTTLESISFSSNITTIDSNTFNGCTSLKTINFDGTVEQFLAISKGDNWIANCNDLEIVCNDGTISLDDLVLAWSYNSTKSGIIITGIGSYADSNLVIPATIMNLPVVEIADNAFKNNTSIESLTIPNSMEKIGDLAFYGCSSITSITFEDNSKLTTIGQSSFEDIGEVLNVIIPNSVTYIGSLAFEGSLIHNIVLSNNLSEIRYETFKDCNNLQYIVIPASVKHIDVACINEANTIIYVYRDYKSKESNTDYDSLADNMYFYSSESPNLATEEQYWHYVDSIPAPWHTHTWSTTFMHDDENHYYATTCSEHDQLKKKLESHINKLNYFECQACRWKIDSNATAFEIPDTVTEIVLDAFANDGKHNNFVQITIPTSVTLIHEDAFKDLTTLKTIIYEGTKAQWNDSNFTRDIGWDNGLSGYVVKCSDGDIEEPLYKYADSSKTSLYFGSYPQTKVEDSTLITTLNTKAGDLPTSTNTYKWTDYGYYANGNVSSYMYYIDIDQDNDGSYDYRGVYFTEYRTSDLSGQSSYAFQETNGYSKNTVYWFKYDRIKWNILTTSDNKAFIMSNLVLDAQQYYSSSTTTRNGDTDYQGNTTTSSIYASNYMYSYIRSWINTTFYNTAFNSLQKELIATTEVDNSDKTMQWSGYSSLVCDNTNDKMFLVSYQEAGNYYNNMNKGKNIASDYAKSQGIYVLDSGYSNCWTRSPSVMSSEETSASVINANGGITNQSFTVYNLNGVVPACWINL